MTNTTDDRNDDFDTVDSSLCVSLKEGEFIIVNGDLRISAVKYKNKIRLYILGNKEKYNIVRNKVAGEEDYDKYNR